MLALQQKIKQAGLRVTHPRMAVLSLLAQQTDDLTVKQIYQRLNLQKQQLSLATVYRVVSDLVLAGLLVSYQFHRAETKFSLPRVSKKSIATNSLCRFNHSKTSTIFTVLRSRIYSISN